MLGHKQQYKGYGDFVMQGVDEETFKEWVDEELLPE